MIKTFLEKKLVCVPGGDDVPLAPGQGGARGIIEFRSYDRNHNLIDVWYSENIVKIFAKEMLAHRLPSSEVWDPNANSGVGGWVDGGRDPNEEFAARYILFGASFDENGLALDTDDSRFYTVDPVTRTPVPVSLGPGAEYDGGLINAIPIAEPNRSLKKVESVSFQATYQPAGTPLVQSDVRAMYNIVQLQTTLRLDEYNGMGVTDSDFFTITEVALAGGRKIDSVATCDCSPRELFLEGVGNDNSPLACIAAGTDVVSISPSETMVDLVKEGDQIKIVGAGDSEGENSISQVSPYYLVVSKMVGGRDIQLDRTPVDSSNNPITGSIGVYRDTLRIFSHRVLASPFKKSNAFEIEVRWNIVMS